MKKMLAWLTCLLVLAVPALAEGPLPEELLIPGQERVTMAEAVGMAYGRMEQLPEEHMSRVNLVRLTDNTHAWVVSVYARNQQTPAAWTFMFSADDGELLWQESAAQGEFVETKQRWMDGKGDMQHWTGEQFRLYERLYGSGGDPAQQENVAITQQEACDIALAALGMTDDSAYQMACSLTGETWQVILVQEGVAMWQVNIDMASGQVLLISPEGQGNG